MRAWMESPSAEADAPAGSQAAPRLVRLLRKLSGRARAALWGALRLNGFVYDACLRARVRRPDIRVRPVEMYGQCGEDLIVRSLLEAKALSDGVDLRRERYLEIGGNHPFATS